MTAPATQRTYDPYSDDDEQADVPEHVEIDAERYASIGHATGEVEAGFDLTEFPSATAFRRLLQRHGLDGSRAFVRVKKSPDRERFAYVWANADVLLVTGNNPITGAYSEPDARSEEKGYASYIGIEGRHDAVEALYDDITETASHIKGRDAGRRSFI